MSDSVQVEPLNAQSFSNYVKSAGGIVIPPSSTSKITSFKTGKVRLL